MRNLLRVSKPVMFTALNRNEFYNEALSKFTSLDASSRFIGFRNKSVFVQRLILAMQQVM